MTTVAPREGVVYGLSCTCHPEDGIRYVGQTVQPLARRLSQHRLGHTSSRSSHLPIYRWTVKHGPETVIAEVLGRALEGESLNLLEVEHIANLGTYGNGGLNATLGGSGTGGHAAKRGGAHHSSVLTDEQAREIYELACLDEFPQLEIAEAYGVSNQTVTNILHGKNYSNIGIAPFTKRQNGNIHMRGSRNHNSKLTDEQVLQAYEDYSKGESSNSIGERLGVFGTTIHAIVSAKTHRYLGLPNISRELADPPPQLGESNYGAKMTEAKVREAYRRVVAGEKCADVANDYGVKSAAISNILTGATWKDLGLTPRVFEKFRNPSNGRMQSRLAELGTVLT